MSIPLLLCCEDSSCDFPHDNRLLPQTVSQIMLLFLRCFYQSTLSQWRQCTYGNALLILMRSEVSSPLLSKTRGKYSLHSSMPTVQVWVIQGEVENFTVFLCSENMVMTKTTQRTVSKSQYLICFSHTWTFLLSLWSMVSTCTSACTQVCLHRVTWAPVCGGKHRHECGGQPQLPSDAVHLVYLRQGLLLA